MGKLKLETRFRVEKDHEHGLEIREAGEQKLEEADASQSAMAQIEAIDDDDQAALDAARSESDGIAKAIAESEIKEPGREVGESLKETAEQSIEYSEIEISDAAKASEMVEDYFDVGSRLSAELQESGLDFQEIAEDSDLINDELQQEYDELAKALEGVF